MITSNSLNSSNRTNSRGFAALLVFAGVLLSLLMANSASAASTAYINGLVYIDENRNGVWDAGEAGYEGVFETREVEADVWERAYYGTAVNFVGAGGNPVDGDNILSAGMQAADEDGNDLCTSQDLEANVEDGAALQRPCAGTFGYIVFADGETWWDVSVTVPEGYEATSDTTVSTSVTAGNGIIVDFGIAPISVDAVDVLETVDG